MSNNVRYKNHCFKRFEDQYHRSIKMMEPNLIEKIVPRYLKDLVNKNFDNSDFEKYGMDFMMDKTVLFHINDIVKNILWKLETDVLAYDCLIRFGQFDALYRQGYSYNPNMTDGELLKQLNDYYSQNGNLKIVFPYRDFYQDPRYREIFDTKIKIRNLYRDFQKLISFLLELPVDNLYYVNCKQNIEGFMFYAGNNYASINKYL